jgi:3-oxoacyl-[acyl-carrier protein] reductase
MAGLLDGKVVIVTGGSRGIGRDTCRVLARHGAKVVVAYAQNGEHAERVVGEVAAEGSEGLAVQVDVRDFASVESLVSQTVARFGRIDGYVNNAISGVQDGALENVTDDDFRNSFDYGCLAVIHSIRATRELFKAQGSGSVVNIVTEIWNMAPANWSVYMAGKGAMVGLSRSLAVELGPEGIRINMVAPGWMATDKVDTASAGSQGFAASLPLRVHGSGEEIGKACVYFISDLSSYVTGAYVPVTGGRITQMGA